MFAQVLHYNPVQRTYSCGMISNKSCSKKKTQKKEWQRKHIHSLSGTTLHCTPFAVGFHHPEQSNLFCKCAIFSTQRLPVSKNHPSACHFSTDAPEVAQTNGLSSHHPLLPVKSLAVFVCVCMLIVLS